MIGENQSRAGTAGRVRKGWLSLLQVTDILQRIQVLITTDLPVLLQEEPFLQEYAIIQGSTCTSVRVHELQSFIQAPA